ncbi:hypothetical protein PAAG_11830 [Paracoccidioides lutzii Pb01]|uniref:Uncharacterized protein n=1 Tax=Paracoccidioides lutzii (strain ATCC MYA-826 / Pb01) TaxID=502779 RepID=A0A0A2V5Q8_PARBA|nr:hypothetical protein PAAG_11830 [Paracoccidioides lutzii Pb01]KGQ01480.1 hypothetical protein PAAG_11830 [Paracoccidioides lutzii Pb01]
MEKESHAEIETLFFGTARVKTRTIELMRNKIDGDDGRRQLGLIFNISSIAGLCVFPGHTYYHAGTIAVEVAAPGLEHIHLVEPSGVKTNFEGHKQGHDPATPSLAR